MNTRTLPLTAQRLIITLITLLALSSFAQVAHLGIARSDDFTNRLRLASDDFTKHRQLASDDFTKHRPHA